jgi:glycosyltransferase involved in cell wall biosynthesis
MKIAIIGPAHPYKGGIAQHTTELAHRLSAAGHQVELISWRTQYPFFYPGQQFVPDGKPELPLHPDTRRVLSWKNPIGWGRWGRHLRQFDQIILIWWVPTIQGPVYLSMLQALGKNRPPVTIICHNVLPHESRPGDRRLARAVLGRCQNVIVHSEAQAALAAELTKSQVITVNLPLILPKTSGQPLNKATPDGQLLFFGIIRPYKGVDILLKALAEVPDVKLTIAGEFWGDVKLYTDLIQKLGLEKRVTIQSGYVPADDLPQLISAADAVVLPYKEGTGSWNVSLVHAYGTPVIATTAGSLANQIHDGVDGLLCKPGDVESLAGAIQHFYEPGVAQKLKLGIQKPTTEADWQTYVQALLKI